MEILSLFVLELIIEGIVLSYNKLYSSKAKAEFLTKDLFDFSIPEGALIGVYSMNVV
jgi:hypothetical protein